MQSKVSVFSFGDLTVLEVSLSAAATLGWRWQITFSTQAVLGCWFVGVYCRLRSSSWQIFFFFPVSVFICPGHQVTRLANYISTDQLIYHDLRGMVCQEYRRWRKQCWPNKPQLALILFSPNRVAWIINLYINFPADRKQHVDMSSVSHGDWSWVWWDGRGRMQHSLADAAIPVNSHILFSLPGSERVSFPSLAHEGVWHRNRIRSEVTRCWVCSSKLSDSLSDWLVLCDGLKSRLGCRFGSQYSQYPYLFKSIVLLWQCDKMMASLC